MQKTKVCNACNSSPTPPQKLLTDKINWLNHISSKAIAIFRANKATTKIILYANMAGETQVIVLSELPAEFQQAFHDYASRLTAERYVLETQLRELNEAENK